MNKKVVVVCSDSFEQVRCDKCSTLLFKALKKSKDEVPVLEIKCRKCGQVKVY